MNAKDYLETMLPDLPQHLRHTVTIATGVVTPIRVAAAAEIERLRDILLQIEMQTATGEGLDPEEAIEIHVLAGGGRDAASMPADYDQFDFSL